MSKKSKGVSSKKARSLPNLAGRIFGQPLMIEPGRAQAMLNAIGPRLGLLSPASDGVVPAGLQIGKDGSAPGPLGAYAAQSVSADDCTYDVVDGVAVIPVHGTLVQRGGWLSAFCGIHSYSWIGNQIEMALDDSNVGGILLDMDSPGGEVAGCFDLADMIFKARGRKPIWSVADEMAFSAAYAIASATDRVILPRTAGVGSVGVICMHADFSKAEADFGVKVTAIYAGDRKNDFSEHEPLGREARQLLQKEIDRVYGIFAGTVARNRGISVEDVRATEAGLYWGPNAVGQGLADAVGTKDAALAELAERVAPKRGPNTIVGCGADSAAGKRMALADNAAAIVTACVEACVPNMASGFIRDGLTIDEVRQRLDTAGLVRGLVARARAMNPVVPSDMAESLITAGASIPQVRKQLFDFLVDNQSGPINSAVTPGARANQSGGQSADAGWGAAFAKIAKEFSDER